MKLYKHQSDALEKLKDKTHVALYWDMGLGKTYGGSEKMRELGAKVNLVICQKSKIDDWIEHFIHNYGLAYLPYNLTNKKDFNDFIFYSQRNDGGLLIGVINYDLVFRRKELLDLENFTLMLDESSLIQNENAKRSAFILKLQADNVILLSGTPTGGKYEKLWSQMRLLGWNIPKEMFYDHYVDYHYDDSNGFPLMVIDGYKNEDRLKRKMRSYGCDFLKTDEVFDLPEQVHQTINVPTTKEYRKFRKDSIIKVGGKWVEDCGQSFHGVDKYVGGVELVGDTTLTKMLYERQLCGQYNADKLEAFRDLVESTNDRLIVFYNFNAELSKLIEIAKEFEKPFSVVNGNTKTLNAYESRDNSITFIQYAAGAMGLNLQKANKIIYFTPPLSSELFEQSKKRTHRIGQTKTCFYYYLICKNSVEEKIYKTLEMRRDYTEALFERGV
jgi:SNF2 family DNA or RNA helicase